MSSLSTLLPKSQPLIWLSILLFTLFACHNQPPAPVLDKEQITREVTAAIWAFHAADTARNAAAVIDLLWPEYTMLVDGQRVAYADVVEGSPAYMASLALFHTTWTELEIIPIAPDAALSSFLFRDSILTKTGELTKNQGPTTFLWRKRNGEWRVRYGDADHYPY